MAKQTKEVAMKRQNVSKVVTSVLTTKELLELAPDRITEDGMPVLETKGTPVLSFSPDGLFSERIFGISRDSEIGKRGGIEKSYADRNKKFAHIDTHIPYVSPLYYRKTTPYIQKILGCFKPTLLEDIINWDSYMVVVEPQKDFFSEYAENIDELKKQGIFKSMSIYSSYSEKYGETYKLMFLDKQKLNRFNTNTEKNRLKSFDKWEDISHEPNSGLHLMSGAYAVLFLISLMNIDEEIIFCYKFLEGVEKIKKKVAVNNKEESEALSEDMSVSKTLLTTAARVSDRLRILISFKKAGTPIQELVKDKMLVIPAGLRDTQISTLRGEVTLTSDPINESYKAIIKNTKIMIPKTTKIKMNTILKNPMDLSWTKDIKLNSNDYLILAPEIIKRITEIHVGGNPTKNMKSIVERLSKKYEIFRQHAVSKRFDYTGRGVITSDPSLELDQIGIPYNITMIWFFNELKDFCMKHKIELDVLYSMGKKVVNNVVGTQTQDIQFQLTLKDINSHNIQASGSANDEEMIHKKLVSLMDNTRVVAIRYPTLHKWNVLGYRMVLVYDNTIHLHPLVCESYNADFDGDQMSLFLIQTPMAIEEVDSILLPSKNMVGANGQPVNTPSQDAVLGIYSMTYKDESSIDTGLMYDSYELMMKDYELGRVGLNDLVSVKMPRYSNSLFEYRYQEYLQDMKLRDIKSNTLTSKRSPKVNSSFDVKRIITTSDIDFDSDITEPNIQEHDKVTITVPEFENPIDKSGIKFVKSTVGRFIFNTLIPQDLGMINREDEFELEVDRLLDEGGIYGVISNINKTIIKKCIEKYSVVKVKFILDLIKDYGYKYATKSGMSMSIQDIYEHPLKQVKINETKARLDEKKILLEKGEITPLEFRNIKIEEWTKTSNELKKVTMNDLPPTNPIKMMSQSGSRGNETQVAQLMSMRGLMNDTSGNTIDEPILSSLLDGLNISEYFTSSYGSRKGMFDRANKTKTTGESTRTSVYGIDDVVVYQGDCGDTDGFLMIPLTIYADAECKTVSSVVKLSERVKGKLAARDILDENGNVICRANEPIHDNVLKKLDELYSEEGIRVRSPLSCKHHIGLCARCYGFNFSKNTYAEVGDAVGISAAQTTGERGSQLTMRTFHTGGVAAGDVTQGFDAVKKLLESTPKTREAQVLLEYIEENYPRFVENTKELMERIGNKVFLGRDFKDAVVHHGNLEYTVDGEKYPITFGMLGIVMEDRFIELQNALKNKIQSTYINNEVNIADIHYEVITRAMTSKLKVVDGGDSQYTIGMIINISDLIVTNIRLLSEGLNPLLVIPSVTSLKALAKDSKKPTTAMTYQNLAEVASRLAIMNAEDNMLSPISSVLMSNPTPTGTGVKEYKDVIENPDKPITLMDIVGEKLYGKLRSDDDSIDIDDEKLAKATVTSDSVSTLAWVAEEMAEELVVNDEQEDEEINEENDFAVNDIEDVFVGTSELMLEGMDIDTLNVDSVEEEKVVTEQPVVDSELNW